MSRAYFPEDVAALTQAIDQADWLANESGYDTVDDLHRSDPELFAFLAAQWREENPMSQLGG